MTKEHYIQIQELICSMNSYYDNPDSCWSFQDVDAQREIGKELVEILEHYSIRGIRERRDEVLEKAIEIVNR